MSREIAIPRWTFNETAMRAEVWRRRPLQAAKQAFLSEWHRAIGSTFSVQLCLTSGWTTSGSGNAGHGRRSRSDHWR
jgi:hypothetical protein